MKEPLVIQRIKRLGTLAGYVSLNYNPNHYYFSVYEKESGTHTYPKSYKELLEDLDKRIAKIEAANDK